MAHNELLERVMAHIEAHPDQHSQGSYFTPTACGTTYCFAGHAAVMSGAEPPTFHAGKSWFVSNDTLKSFAPGLSRYEDMEEPMHVSTFAGVKLQLSDVQRNFLFSAATTVPELRAMVDAIKARPGIGHDGLVAAMLTVTPC